jgi:hypothetical protein
MTFIRKMQKKYKVKASFGDVKKYVAFLKGTLIPDLKESGKVETAKDFEAMIKFLDGAKQANGMTKEHFINFISSRKDWII